MSRTVQRKSVPCNFEPVHKGFGTTRFRHESARPAKLGPRLSLGFKLRDLTAQPGFGSNRWRTHVMDEETEKRLRTKRDFTDFLEHDHGHGQYADKVKHLVDKDIDDKSCLRLEVDVHDLLSVKQELHQGLFNDPSESIPAFEEALSDYIKTSFPKVLEDNQQVIFDSFHEVCHSIGRCSFACLETAPIIDADSQPQPFLGAPCSCERPCCQSPKHHTISSRSSPMQLVCSQQNLH